MSSTPPRPLGYLDSRQSAMLAEMGLTTWWRPRALLPRPGSGDSVPVAAAAPQPLKPAVHQPAAPPPPAPKAAPPAAAPAAAAASTASADMLPPSASVEAIDSMDWPALEAAIRTCQRCGLCRGRQQAVPGVGDRQPTWLIVGEAPGEEEDRQGEPFVGRAGQLLDRMLAAMGLQRGKGVYIANVLKCRPPRNRNPLPEEMALCAPYLRRQIALLQPRIVLALGRFAAQTLLTEGACLDAQTAASTPLGRLRGRVYPAQLAGQTRPLVISYHPAYLLRNPADKAKAWADLCLALETLESAGTGSPTPG